MSFGVFDSRRCQLGEGPMWHTARESLLWVDILASKVLWRRLDGHAGERGFDRPVSALAALSDGRILAADDEKLFAWSPERDDLELLVRLEADIASNRANDGRADPWGGFWIGTMDRQAGGPVGSIYRWARGELRRIVEGISIPNGICFDKDRQRAYFTDTPTHILWRVDCDTSGWPVSRPQVHLDLSSDEILIDGAVTDALGNIRAACWDRSLVLTISPEGGLGGEQRLSTPRPTSTAFGGPDNRTLFCTTAAFGLDDDLAAGQTYMSLDVIGGQVAPAVKLP